MNKLEYDNLYKFLVSLGIILIALPLIALIYFYNANPILISQVEYDSLSKFSLQMIDNRNYLLSIFVKIFPWFTVIFILSGIVLIVCGIIKWFGVQKKLDKKLDAEITKKTLDELQATKEEVNEKIKKETVEYIQNNFETLVNNNHGNKYPQGKTYEKALEIEQLCFDFCVCKYSKNYDFKQNIRIGETYYDFIGVSKNDDVDLVVEVKYFRRAASISHCIYNTFEKMYEAGLRYQKVVHRDFKCIVIMVTPKEELPRLENIVETYRKVHIENASRIDIKCMAEESL